MDYYYSHGAILQLLQNQKSKAQGQVYKRLPSCYSPEEEETGTWN